MMAIHAMSGEENNGSFFSYSVCVVGGERKIGRKNSLVCDNTFGKLLLPFFSAVSVSSGLSVTKSLIAGAKPQKSFPQSSPTVLQVTVIDTLSRSHTRTFPHITLCAIKIF